jgi:hypothetical protein
MTMKKGSKFVGGYATIDDNGVNYRDIADTMTELGYKMNHSSARNYVLRVMRKFVDAIADQHNIRVDAESAEMISKSPLFQNGISDLLQDLEARRKLVKNESN